MRKFAFLAALFLGAGVTSGQTLSSIVPEAAQNGDLVVLHGTGLAGTTLVRFTGNVGGFAGIWDIDVAPVSVSDTEVRAVVPQFSSFVGPAAVPPSSPFGSVSLVGTGASVKFYFMEEKHGQVTTPGIGTTQSNGERSVGHFDIAAGEPVQGNPNFTPKLGLAVPGALPVLAVGVQAPPPFLPIGDGELLVDLSSGFFALVVGPTVDAAGNSSVSLPLPPLCIPPVTTEDPVCNFPVAMQWGMLDPASGSFVISSGMFVIL